MDVGSGRAGKGEVGEGDGWSKGWSGLEDAVGKVVRICEEWVEEVLKGDEVHRVRKGDGRVVVG